MKDVAASIRSRLLNLSRSSRQPFDTVLLQFAMGRLLYRLSMSPYRDQFVLKGAQLFRLWKDDLPRPTRDLDFPAFGTSSQEAMVSTFADTLKIDTDPADGLQWNRPTASTIRDDVAYGGIRLAVIATLDNARIPLQIDIGFGDVITPKANQMTWNGLLNFQSAQLLAYPADTVIAEKLQAAVVLGRPNSRMKYLFDLYWLSQNQSFDGGVLSKAVRATFARRETPIPGTLPDCLSSDFANDTGKQIQWQALLTKENYKHRICPFHSQTEKLFASCVERHGRTSKVGPSKGLESAIAFSIEMQIPITTNKITNIALRLRKFRKSQDAENQHKHLIYRDLYRVASSNLVTR